MSEANTIEGLRSQIAQLKARLDEYEGTSSASLLADRLGLRWQSARVLALLYRRSPRLLSRSAIQSAIWPEDGAELENPRSSISIAIHNLRHDLVRIDAPAGVVTHYGAGYSCAGSLALWLRERLR